MKKNRIGTRSDGWIFVRKCVLMMKFVFIFMMCCLFQIQAAVYSQQAKVSVEFRNVSLEKVFQELERQSNCSFLYNHRVVEARGRVSIQVVDKELSQVLDELLTKLGLGFTFDDNLVIIKERTSMWGKDSVQKGLRIVGRVVDEKKQAMPGVTVKLTGTTLGTATDSKGIFSMMLPLAKGALEFSFVGYKTQSLTFSATTRDTIRIVMQEDIQALDEAVVVAYGTTTRREATGAISVIKADELRGIPSGSIASLLQGRVAGMDVTNITGAPGGGGTIITIRGYNSLDVEQKSRQFSNPLWVVDGVPLNSFTSPITGTNLLAEINPDMIESVQVLKDASAASIYGSRAANGVIIVTTKKGRANQKATFSVNVSQTWSVLPKLPTLMVGRAERWWRIKALRNMPKAYLDWENRQYKYPSSISEMEKNRLSFLDWFYPKSDVQPVDGIILQDSLNAFYNHATNFFPMYFETGKVTNANIQTYGGSDRINYGFGLGYYNEAGVLKGTGFNRIDLTTNLNVIPANRLNVDLRFYLSLTNRKRSSENQMEGFQTSASVDVIPGDPFELTTLLPGKGSVVWDEVLKSLQGIKEKNRSVRGRANIKIGYDVLDGLNVSTSLAADYSIHRRHYFSPSYLDTDGYSMSIGETGINVMALSETMLTYTKTIKEDHTFNLLAGFSYQYDQEEYNGGSGRNSPSDKIQYVPSGFPTLAEKEIYDYKEVIPLQAYESDMKEKSLLSWFARLEYDYQKKYFISASFRRDGSSTFGAKNRWGTFPSIAGGWNFSEESFIKDNLEWLSFGKIRASWGRSGMHFEECYLALGSLYSGQPFMGESTLSWGNGLYNEELSWEKTDQYDFGLDMDMFNYRLGLTLDYYYRYSSDKLWQIELPGDYNGFAYQWRNAAAVSNEGIELLIRYEIFRKDNLYWKISVNGAKNWNRFEKSYTGEDIPRIGIIGKALNGIYTLATDGFVNKQDELPVTYNNAGISSYLNNGDKSTFYKPGDYKFIDVNGDGIISEEDRIYQGSALPVVTGGIVNEVRWKNFDLNMSVTFQIGRHIVNTLVNSSLKTSYPNEILHPFMMNMNKQHFWQQPGDTGARYTQWQTDQGVGNYNTTDRDVEKVNWLKLKTLSIGYTLPASLMKSCKLEQVRFFVSGENLLSWHNYSGLDPEIVDVRTGFDTGKNYPLARKFTLGLTVKF